MLDARFSIFQLNQWQTKAFIIENPVSNIEYLLLIICGYPRKSAFYLTCLIQVEDRNLTQHSALKPFGNML